MICADAVCRRGVVERLALTEIARPALTLAPRADCFHLDGATVPMPCQPNWDTPTVEMRPRRSWGDYVILFVVARTRLDRYEVLRGQFGHSREVKIVLDRQARPATPRHRRRRVKLPVPAALHAPAPADAVSTRAGSSRSIAYCRAVTTTAGHDIERRVYRVDDDGREHYATRPLAMAAKPGREHERREAQGGSGAVGEEEGLTRVKGSAARNDSPHPRRVAGAARASE